MNARELRRLRSLGGADSITYNETFCAFVMSTRDGHCVHLQDDGLCRLHANHGESSKPDTCRCFPLRLIATPEGGRIVTEHRCPCRTMGERPALDSESAKNILAPAGGKLRADDRTPQTIRMAPRKYVRFSSYRRIEQAMIDRLLEGDSVPTILQVAPFCALDDRSWPEVATVFRSLVDGTSCTEALGWFGDAILCLTTDFHWTRTRTPWHRSFDRAEQRSPVIASPNAMLADWIADSIFGFEWLARGSFEAAKRELQTRAAIADFIATRRQNQGARADRAMAEAIMICDLAGASQHWDAVVAAIEQQLAALK